MSQALGAAFAELRDNPDLWVGILTAEGEKNILCWLGFEGFEFWRSGIR